MSNNIGFKAKCLVSLAGQTILRMPITKKVFIAFYLSKAATLFGSWSCLLWIQLVAVRRLRFLAVNQNTGGGSLWPPAASWLRLNGDLVDLRGICQGKKNHVSSGKRVNLEFRKREAACNNSLLPLYWALHFMKYIHYSIWFSLQKILWVIYCYSHFTQGSPKDLETKAHKEKGTWPKPRTEKCDSDSGMTSRLDLKSKL